MRASNVMGIVLGAGFALVASVSACGGAQTPPASSGSSAGSSSAGAEGQGGATGADGAAGANGAGGSPGSGAASGAGAASAGTAGPGTPPPAASASSGAPVPDSGGSVLIGEIAGTPKFNPKQALQDSRDDLLTCFRKIHAANPAIHGKVTLRITVDETGHVTNVDANPGGTANDPALVTCIRDAMRSNAHFPKPGGSATIVAPLVFRP